MNSYLCMRANEKFMHDFVFKISYESLKSSSLHKDDMVQTCTAQSYIVDPCNKFIYNYNILMDS